MLHVALSERSACAPISRVTFIRRLIRNAALTAGFCLRTCRSLPFYTTPQTVYACRSRDTGLRARSSSGGAFTALARQVIARGGYVCGAGYVDGCGEVRHLLARDETALDNLRRSKFVQSTKYDIYKTIKTLLDQGAEVLLLVPPARQAVSDNICVGSTLASLPAT
ncbi:MAG: coenzyme F420 hydrogenase/dehydrogenase beta subunit N-terminal domain-containing protein [Alistipes indistinctus]